MDSCWAKKGRKESVKPGVESVEPIVQYSTRPANVFSFFFFFPVDCVLISLCGAVRAVERRAAGKFEPLPVLCK